ncbi:MAG: 30S ribosomal protein S1 [Arcobacter butzleri]|jgi:small subunit ribosomal protein S1|nr:30S ribosomal protein S1 [Arcobacteraceae bacterium]MDY0365168.1 30S ribosomal protein S1 [Arcobacteraceae bacterium]NLO16581.1 30S ribosomal protein S1 [Aliarcobacter butzleri]
MGIDRLNIEQESEFQEMSFEQMLNESFENSENSAIIDGVIVDINDSIVLIDVGQKIEGILNVNEIKDSDGNLMFKIGDTIKVMIMGTKGERPSISYKNVLQREKFDEFVEKYGEDFEELIIEGKIVEAKKRGGFSVVDKDGLEYFLPMAQSYMKPQGAIGKKIKAKVLKINKNQNSIIISRKKLIEENKKDKEEKISAIIDANSTLNGIVKKITSYGMFVEVNGIDGLVNYNEISYKGPVNPANYYKEGDEVSVKVLNYDKDKQHLSLSVKAALPDPWKEIKDELDVGDAITVTVSNFESYGAFVDLGNDIEGLLHVSEISWNKNLKNPKDLLNIGDEINVEVIELDTDKRKLRVSLKNLQEKPFSKFTKEFKVGDIVEGKVATLTDFGAFVTIGEIDALLHNEEASWDNSVKCKSTFKKGDAIKAKIIKIDTDKENVSISIKETIDSPTAEFAKKHAINDIVKAPIKDIKDFGIFVILENGIDGLIRSEDLGTLKPEELAISDEIEAAIINIDTKRNRVRLSARKVESLKQREALKSINDDSGMTLGDLIKDQFGQN